MGAGVQVAIHEIALVVFSTLTPAGAVACTLLALLSMVAPVEHTEHTRIRHLMGLPLTVATVGLITASTHLGTPANALYVVTGIGRSPLSNEMLCTLPFLAVTGVYWLYSFSREARQVLLRILGALVAVLGMVCVGGISLAYNQPTIPAWDTPFTTAGIWLGAFAAGVPLFLLTTHLARTGRAVRGFERRALALGVLAVVSNVACETARWVWMQGMGNEMFTLAERAPNYPWYIVAFCVFSVASYVLCFAVCPSRKGAAQSTDALGRRFKLAVALFRKRGVVLVLASTLALTGFLTMRFAFYTLYFTVGISL